MENTTPGPLKINLTSTPCMKRKSLFAAPDVSPIRNGTNSKRNSATSIVSKIPVKLAARKLSTRIPRLSGQTKTSEPEKPVLRTIDNIDQTDATEKNKGKKGNKSPKVAATNKEASLSERASTSTSSKKNGVDNLSKMEWEAMEILSHEVLSPVSKRGSNLDIDLDDDDNGDFEPTKKGKKNQSNSKKCPSPKKGKQTDSKGADKKPAKSARGKKKADAEDTEVILENIPEETKINSKMQLDGETANKIAETRRVVKKGPNKDQKKPPARNKRKFADPDLEPVVEESNDAEDEKKVVTRNTRKTVGGDFEPVAEVDEEAMDVEDEPKSPVRKKRTFDLGPVAEEPKNVEDPKDSLPKNKNGTFDLGPVADEPKNLEDQNKTPTRNKRKSADFHPEKAEEPIEVEGKRKRPTRNVKKTSSAPAPDVIAETKAIDAEMKEEPAKTRKMPRAKKMKADKKEKDCASEPSVEVPEEEKNEDALNVDEKAVERSSPAKKKVVGFNSFNASGGKRQIPLNRIFGNPLITDSKESPTPVKVFRSIKPSENVMGGFISLLPSSSHSGLSTNYNLYFLMSDTQLKVNIMGVERIIENQLTSFVVPKDCRFSIENVGSGTAILSFTKLRSI